GVIRGPKTAVNSFSAEASSSRSLAIPKSSSFGEPSAVTGIFTGLEVAVNDELLVRVGDRFADLQEELAAFRQPQPLFLAVVVNRLAFHVLHHEVRSFFGKALKPGNILVTADGSPKLLDFGIVKLLDEDASAQNELTAVFGPRITPDYASPEQVRGDPITTASDVYSLSAILYELLCGVRPHRFNANNL